jgi:hypothetical protein
MPCAEKGIDEDLIQRELRCMGQAIRSAEDKAHRLGGELQAQ